MGLLVFYARLGWVAGPGRIDVVYQYSVETVTGLLLLDAALGGQWEAFANALSHLALPAALLGYFSLAYISRMTRSFMLKELAQEYIVAALLHDIGDELAPITHGEFMGAVLRPYCRPEIVWIVKHHGVFQSYYYAHHSGGDRNARDRFKDSPWFDACAEFCAKYDQNCFDPNFESLPAEFFMPMVRRVFAEPRYLTGDELI
jgi:hypothetical protein